MAKERETRARRVLDVDRTGDPIALAGDLMAVADHMRVLVDALRPFAAEADQWDEAEPMPDLDSHPMLVEATVADLRAARAALDRVEEA